MVGLGEDIDRAFEGLKELVSTRIRDEQLRNQLTRLPNLLALEEALRRHLSQPKPSFWIAFVEVDRFKTINDVFGYTQADALLRSIAEHLHVARAWFPGTTTAYHPHGDEFYLLADTAMAPKTIDEKLRALTDAIARIHLVVEKTTQTMSCTVSVAWLTSSDVPPPSAQFLRVERNVFNALERAMEVAKWDRGNIVRYSQEMTESTIISLRASCSSCVTKFTLNIRQTASYDAGSQLFCPNCGGRIERPAHQQGTRTESSVAI